MNITAFNFDTTELEKTTITSRVNSGTAVFKVRNSDRFTIGNKVLVGEMSRERSEILTIQSITATQITMTGNAKFNHDPDDPIYQLDYDQVRFFRSTTGPNGTYAQLATVDIDVDNTSGKTLYDDLNALDSYYYKVAFYDSVNALESELSAPLQSSGYDRDQIGRAILDVATRIRDTDFMFYSIEDWLVICNDISDDLIVRAKRPYSFLKKSIQIDILPGDDSFPFPADLWKIDYVEVNVANPSSARVYQPKKIGLTDMRYRRSINTMPSDDVYEVAYDDTKSERKILFNPAARTERIGAFTLHYYSFPEKFTSLASYLQTPTAAIYKMGMFREYYMQKADDDAKYAGKAQNYDQKYEGEIMKLQREKQIDAHAPKGMGPQVRRYRQ